MPGFSLSRALLGLLLLGGAWLASCDPVDPGNRRCVSQIPATTIASPESTCGERTSLKVNLCERLSDTKCPSSEPVYVCLSTPGDRGFLIELSPCATLESIPEGWAFAEDYERGIMAVRECKTARNRCDGSTIPFVARDEMAGSAGAAGQAGTSGASGAGEGGSSTAGAGGSVAGTGGSVAGTGGSVAGAGGSVAGAGGAAGVGGGVGGSAGAKAGAGGGGAGSGGGGGSGGSGGSGSGGKAGGAGAGGG